MEQVPTVHDDRYDIPLKYRKMENLHIVFWLFIDVAWCLGFRWLGTSMILPTLIISIIIAYRTRQYMSELCHNVAITVWISANSYWMVSEFFGFDHIELIPFTAGILILGYFYLVWKPMQKNKSAY